MRVMRTSSVGSDTFFYPAGARTVKSMMGGAWFE
jgi:hypothetical protein